MKGTAKKIKKTVDDLAGRLEQVGEEAFSAKPSPGKWSPKEIIGHLTDSCQNNIQRFVRAQYEDKPRIVYSQDDWVSIQAYQKSEKSELIRLWVALNHHLCRVLTEMDPAQYGKECNTGKEKPELHTLTFLAEDYLAHMHHHLNQLDERLK